MTTAPQLMPSVNGMNEVAKNADGSVNLYFGPQKPAGAADDPSRHGVTAATGLTDRGGELRDLVHLVVG